MRFSRPGYVMRQGIPLMMPSSVNVRIMSGDKEVETLTLGHAGFSDGPQSASLSVKNAIPEGGFEYDCWGMCLNHQDEVLSFRLANIILTIDGRVTDSSAETTTNAPNSLDFDFKGKVVAYHLA